MSIKGIQKGCTVQAMGIKNKTQKQKQTNKQTKTIYKSTVGKGKQKGETEFPYLTALQN